MPAEAPNNPGRQFKTFGWQGIRLTVPAEWEMVATRGDWESGYVALADGSAMRLQVKWDPAVKGTDPSDAASRYIRELRKQAKKDKAEITVNRQLNLASLSGKKLECYEWVSHKRGTGMVSRCDDCDRVVHVAVLGKKDESLRNLSRTVFASLRDHPEDGETLWKFYDVEFRSPATMRLRRSELKTGCVRMQLTGKRREAEVVRVSLAAVLLAKQSLREWLEEFYCSELKRMGREVRQETFHGHAGVRVDARPWLILNPTRLIGRTRRLAVACWHCEDSNRIFIVGHAAIRGDETEMRNLVHSVRCCGTPD